MTRCSTAPSIESLIPASANTNCIFFLFERNTNHPCWNQIPCSRGLLTFLCSHADPLSSSNPTAPPRWLVRCSRGRRWLGSPSPGSARSLVWDHRTSSPHLLAPTGPGVLFFTAKQRFWRHAPGVLARGLACAAAYVEDAPWAPVIGLVGSLIKHM